VNALVTASGFFGSSGGVDLTVNGGSGLFSFDWSGPAQGIFGFGGPFAASTEDISGVKSGDYMVTITDLVTGCTYTNTFSVPRAWGSLWFKEDGMMLEAMTPASENSVTVFPNPTNGVVNIELALTDLGNVEILVFDMLGNKAVHQWKGEDVYRYTHQLDLSNMASGQYLVKVIIRNEVINRKLVLTR